MFLTLWKKKKKNSDISRTLFYRPRAKKKTNLH